MDGTNADSDNSMTWEDFFGSTTDLTPTLIGIYDSLLEPDKSLRPEVNGFITAKDARNDPPVIKQNLEDMTEKSKENPEVEGAKDPTKLPGGVKLPVVSINKSSLYSSMRTKSVNGASETKSDFTTSDSVIVKESQIKTINNVKQSEATFGNLSPNVKRMISSATETTTLKFQKKTGNVVRSSGRYKTNIPLVGATSKISQSGVDILPSVEIYAQPTMKQVNKKVDIVNAPTKILKPDFILNEVQTTYDVPTNNRPTIYDVPNSNNKTAFESLSLPYIDQSIELSISSNDREFDTKLSSKESSPQKPNVSPKASPAKIQEVDVITNNLNRNDLPSDSPVKKLAKTQPYPEAIGSTGNLKSGTLEKEVQRINPPTVEVSRPLSMSSIASSSSTSSSGVQNKGGVNSAYLASIESLDDHSDADLTSANGSNNFVNGAGILSSSVSEDKILDNLPREQMEELSGLTQLERVLTEIVQTENVYVEDLRQVVEGYLHVWRKEVTFSSEELSELFNNIEDIYAFNRSLCEELNGCSLDAVCIARCFVSNTAGFAVYASYCTGYPKTMERLAELASKVQSAREFRERQVALGHPLPLASYLLKPVQRILKYHLLLQNVVKHSSTQETQYALLQMTAIAQHIDDMKRKHEHAVRVQEIQSLLYGWNGPDLTTYGELCAEGTFRVWGAKALRHVFLFDNMLLVTKNRDDSVLAYKSHIMCNNMMLVESISGAALSFHVIPWDAPREQLTLQARNTAHKRQWTLLLKRVILENYNAVIPSHARQLVMELGQNKTDDDMLAEKSHNLIGQASMRKQLSAPEYLEKRKLERERRKAFETSIRGRMKKINRNHTIPNSRTQDCDCSQVSIEKGTDYTCDICYIDLCSDCENEPVKGKYQCDCNNKDGIDKCPDCDKSLQFIDGGSAENLERRSACKCSDFKSSQESFSKDVGNLNKTRGYHSSDNIVGYTDTKSKEELNETNNSLINVRNIPRTCLKCCKIKENIAIDSTNTLRSRKSRMNDIDRQKADTLRSKSKDDPQRNKLSKISSWRRKSEPGLQQNTIGILTRKPQDSDSDKNDARGSEKIEFECRNCGSNKISRKTRNHEGIVISDPELEKRGFKSNIEIKMYNAKNVPKKISKLKKNRAKGLRLGSDTTAKFYADLSSDVSTENILHISESNDSLNVDKPKETKQQLSVPGTLPKDEDMDEETYKKLLEKTDSFKKNELEKVMFLNQQKVINEGSEIEEKMEDDKVLTENVQESGEETEQPLEQIISQLLMQNREFQKLIKKQQLRNSSQKRHQRLLKSHSNPEQVIAARNGDLSKIKPKFVRQNSENLELVSNKIIEVDLLSPPNEKNEPNDADEDHIYETLRVDNKKKEEDSQDSKTKLIPSPSRIARPKRLPSPPKLTQDKVNKISPVESDYVYLSFDQLNKIQDSEGIYEVPVKSPEKVRKEGKPSDYYVAMANNELTEKKSEENLYDNLIDVRRRKKEDVNVVSTDYLPMSSDQSPNTPEIWLSRQKEHFNVSRDRKSGSLPRSFQVVTSNQEDSSLSSFKLKPNNNSKTYLNRDGKVMSTDRPFTIASDQSEISYDDVENYMSDGDILKFNNKKVSSETEYVQDISQSTLDLEEEIDRCYKNNFEKVKISSDDNENHLTMSQTNLNISMTSSCEGLPLEENTIKEVIHPEHKIYKPNSNMLSLKNVLSRFKNKAPNKSTEENDVNANDPNSPDSGKSDLKSPTGEKRSGLNPRSYSKNLLQRFRSIIGDEHQDTNQNRPDVTVKGKDESQIKSMKNDIKVVITSTDTSPTASTITYATNADALSRSVCEHTTLTESQNEKNNLDAVSQSCENITQKSEHDRPMYDKSVSMVSSVSSNTSNTSSPIKSSLHQSFNKIPMYMQGSKHLGARIAQSDYVDPATLKSSCKSVNVLINKNSVRPDSLFSNSSFVTLSSEGVYQENQTKSLGSNDQNDSMKKNKLNTPDVESHDNDESFYEKSFETIEQVTDEDVFRDSAVYSDQEDTDDSKPNVHDNVTNKAASKVEHIKKNSSFRAQKVTVTTNEKSTLHSHISISSNVTQKVNKLNTLDPKIESDSKVIRTKEAPPIPIKPKTTNIPSAQTLQHKVFIQRNTNLIKNQEQSSSSESVNVKTIKRNTNYKPNFKTESQLSTVVKKTNNDEGITRNTTKDEIDNASKIKQPHNQLLKRATFERASLDSATRKLKTINTSNEIKRSSVEPPKTTKTVLERRMEIEQMSKTDKSSNNSNSSVKKSQIAKPVSITTKVATFERSISEKSTKEVERPTANEKHNINRREKSFIDQVKSETSTDDPKGSWVKQVVNKFQ